LCTGRPRFRIGRLTCDHDAIDGDDTSAVQALIKTLFDIITIREGPESIPHSYLLLYIAVALRFFPLFVAVLLLPNFTVPIAILAGAGWLISLAAFSTAIALAGYKQRLLQALTAIIGCNALILLARVAGRIFLPPFLGIGLVRVIVGLLILWSVRVEGHIITRTINCKVHEGLLIAIGVLVLEYAFSVAVLRLMSS